ncbi:MAG TPA: DUF4870 domain-containing protein [Bryobacteraceae bacterium]|nr:DUF4870 domain-containing protein [Bryobacteraceae bacterium]
MAATTAQPPPNPPAGAQGSGQQYTPPPAGNPHAPSPAAGLTDNVAGSLAYLLGIITGIVFLVLPPYNQNKFIRFHAFQAIFLHLALIAGSIVVTIIGAGMPYGLMPLASLLWAVVWLCAVAAWIFCIIKAYNHERFKLPVIGDLAEKQA